MARKKRDKGGGDGGPNWMDTYGDMVTLLLCFFVLLLSTSDTNTEKWAILVRSLNPNLGQVSQIVDMMAESPGEYPVEGGVDQPIDPDITETLYYTIKKYIEENNLSSSVSVTKGDGYEFITFDSTVFFLPDSSVIQDSGKTVLDGLSNILAPLSERIDEIRILGHTSQASAETAYDLHKDRYLASNRADAVLLYIQDKNIISPAKLVSVGYGQYRPIASFQTEEGRSKNRRVEMIISTTQTGQEDAVERYYQSRESQEGAISAEVKQETEQSGEAEQANAVVAENASE